MVGEFGLKLDRFAKITEARAKNVVRKIALEVFRRIILRTPVRTGMARGSWQATAGRRTPLDIERPDKSGRVALAEMTECVKNWDPLHESRVWIQSNCPYIERLEHGSSKQAPAGMVTITLAEFGAIAVDAAAESMFGSWGGTQGGADRGSGWDIGGAGE